MLAGGLAGAVFTAAKERRAGCFHRRQIGFTDMAQVVEDVLTKMSSEPELDAASITLDNVAQTDHLARLCAGDAIKTLRTKA